jgi:hypothetical protein
MSSFVQILTCQTDLDCSASFLLFSDSARCLVQCGAGTQRFAAEHGVKLARLTHVLLASSHWSAMAGLPGLLLTVADSGMTRLHITAPRGAARTLVAARTFLHRPQCTLSLSQYGADAVHSLAQPVLSTAGFQVFATVVVVSDGEVASSCSHLVPMTQVDLSKLRSDPCGCAAAASPTFDVRAVALAVHAADIPGKFDAVRVPRRSVCPLVRCVVHWCVASLLSRRSPARPSSQRSASRMRCPVALPSFVSYSLKLISSGCWPRARSLKPTTPAARWRIVLLSCCTLPIVRSIGRVCMNRGGGALVSTSCTAGLTPTPARCVRCRRLSARRSTSERCTLWRPPSSVLQGDRDTSCRLDD